MTLATRPPVMPTAIPTTAVVRAALDEVPDPEIPNVSVVELGMIGDVEVEASELRVELLPTFVGCPAIEVIRDAIATRLAGFGLPVLVDVSFSTPWSSDRITPTGREKLRRSGFAPPAWVDAGRALPMLDAPIGRPLPSQVESEASVPCPFCCSSRTTMEGAFGPTLCRMVWHCSDCRQPFEAFKPI